MTFEVIKGNKELVEGYKKVKREAMKRSSINFLAKHAEGHESASDDEKVLIAWHMMNLVVLSRGDGDISELCLYADAVVNNMLQGVAIETFETYFPIRKTYDGDRWGTIDYLYTKEWLSGLKTIQEVGAFLMEYDNKLVRKFMVTVTTAMSQKAKERYGADPIEEFMKASGVPIYKLSEQHGKKVLTNTETGEQQVMEKPKPKHLQIVK